MTKKANSSRLPSDEEILAKRAELDDLAGKVVRGEYQIKRDTVQAKLDLVREQLTMFNGKNIPYSTIREILAQTVGLRVSDQTLRKYCQERLGFSKRGATASNTPSDTTSDAKIARDTLTSKRQYD